MAQPRLCAMGKLHTRFLEDTLHLYRITYCREWEHPTRHSTQLTLAYTAALALGNYGLAVDADLEDWALLGPAGGRP